MAAYAAVDGQGRLIAQGEQNVGTLQRLKEAATRLLAVQERAAAKETDFQSQVTKASDKLPERLKEILERDFRKTLKEVFDPLFKAAEKQEKAPAGDRPATKPAGFPDLSKAIRPPGGELDAGLVHGAMTSLKQFADNSMKSSGSVYVHDAEMGRLMASLGNEVKGLRENLGREVSSALASVPREKPQATTGPAVQAPTRMSEVHDTATERAVTSLNGEMRQTRDAFVKAIAGVNASATPGPTSPAAGQAIPMDSGSELDPGTVHPAMKAMQMLAERGGTPGSIYTHDTHAEKVLAQLFGVMLLNTEVTQAMRQEASQHYAAPVAKTEGAGPAAGLDAGIVHSAMQSMKTTMDMGSKPGSMYTHDIHVEQLLVLVHQELKSMREGMGHSLKDAIIAIDMGKLAAGLKKSAEGPAKAAEKSASAGASAEAADPFREGADSADAMAEGVEKAKKAAVGFDERARSVINTMGETKSVIEGVAGVFTTLGTMARDVRDLTSDQQQVLANTLKDMAKANQLDQLALLKLNEYLNGLEQQAAAGDQYAKTQKQQIQNQLLAARTAEDFNRILTKAVEQSRLIRVNWDQIVKTMKDQAINTMSYRMASMPGQLASGVTAGLDMGAAFRGIVTEQVKWNTQMRETLYMTQGLTAANDRVRNQYMEMGRAAENVAVTGMHIVDYQEAYLKNLQAGTRELKTLVSVTRTGANLGFMIGADAKQTAKTFGDWQRQTGMSTVQMAQFSREVRAAGQNVGVMGDELVAAVQQARELADAMRDAGTLTASASGAFAQFSAAAKKLGTEKSVKPLLDGLSSTVSLYQKVNAETQTLLFQAAARVGRVQELRTGSVMQNQEAQKDMVKGMKSIFSSLAMQIAGTDKINRMNEQQKMQLNMQLQAAYGMQLGEFQRTLETLEEGSKTFDDRLQDINKKLQSNLTVREREALLDQKRGMELQNMLKKLTQIDESAKDAKSMQEAFDSVKMSQEEVRRNLAGSIDRVNQSLAKAGKGKESIDSSRIEAALKDPAQYRELLDAINTGEQKAATAQKAATDPVAQAMHKVNEFNAKIVENTGRMLAVLTSSLGANGIILMGVAAMFLNSNVIQNALNTIISTKLTSVAASLAAMPERIAAAIKAMPSASDATRGLALGGGTAGAVAGEEALDAARKKSVLSTGAATGADEIHIAVEEANAAATSHGTVVENIDTAAAEANAAANTHGTLTENIDIVATEANAAATGSGAVVENADAAATAANTAVNEMALVVEETDAVATAANTAQRETGTLATLYNTMAGWREIAMRWLWGTTTEANTLALAGETTAKQSGWLWTVYNTMATWRRAAAEQLWNLWSNISIANTMRRTVAEQGFTFASIASSIATWAGTASNLAYQAAVWLVNIATGAAIIPLAAVAAGFWSILAALWPVLLVVALLYAAWKGLEASGISLTDIMNGVWNALKNLWTITSGLLNIVLWPLIQAFKGLFIVLKALFGWMGSALETVAGWFGGGAKKAEEESPATSAENAAGSQEAKATAENSGQTADATKAMAEAFTKRGSGYTHDVHAEGILREIAATLKQLLEMAKTSMAGRANSAGGEGAKEVKSGGKGTPGGGIAPINWKPVTDMHKNLQGVDNLPDPGEMMKNLLKLFAWLGLMGAVLALIFVLAPEILAFTIAFVAGALVFVIAVNACLLAVGLAFKGILWGMAIGADKALAEGVEQLPNPLNFILPMLGLLAWIVAMGAIMAPMLLFAVEALLFAAGMLAAGLVMNVAFNAALLAVWIAFKGIAFGLVIGLDEYLEEQVAKLPNPLNFIMPMLLLLGWIAAMGAIMAPMLLFAVEALIFAAGMLVAGAVMCLAFNAAMLAVWMAFKGIAFGLVQGLDTYLEEQVDKLPDPMTLLQQTLRLVAWVGMMGLLLAPFLWLGVELLIFGAAMVVAAAFFVMAINLALLAIWGAFNGIAFGLVQGLDAYMAEQVDMLPDPGIILEALGGFSSWMGKMMVPLNLMGKLATAAFGHAFLWWWTGGKFRNAMNEYIWAVASAFFFNPTVLLIIHQRMEEMNMVTQVVKAEEITQSVRDFVKWLDDINAAITEVFGELTGKVTHHFSWWTLSFHSIGELFKTKVNELIQSVSEAFEGMMLERLMVIPEKLEMMAAIREMVKAEEISQKMGDFVDWLNKMNAAIKEMTGELDAAAESFTWWGRLFRRFQTTFADKVGNLIQTIEAAFGAIRLEGLMIIPEKMEMMAMIREIVVPKDVKAGLDKFVTWLNQMNAAIKEMTGELDTAGESFSWWGRIFRRFQTTFADKVGNLIQTIETAFNAIQLDGLSVIHDKQLEMNRIVTKVLPDKVKEDTLAFITWLNQMNAAIKDLTGKIDQAGVSFGFWRKSFVSFGQMFASKMGPLIESIQTAFNSLDTDKLEVVFEKLAVLNTFPERMDPYKVVMPALWNFISWANRMQGVIAMFTPMIAKVGNEQVKVWIFTFRETIGQTFARKINDLIDSIAVGIGGIRIEDLEASFAKLDKLMDLPPTDMIRDALDDLVLWCNDMNTVITEMSGSVIRQNARTNAIRTVARRMSDSFNNMIGVIKSVFDGLDTTKLAGTGSKLDGRVVDKLPTRADVKEAFDAVLNWAGTMEAFILAEGQGITRQAMRASLSIRLRGGMMTYWFTKLIESVTGMFAGLNTGPLKNVGRNLRGDVVNRMPTAEDVKSAIDVVLKRIESIAAIMPTMLDRVREMEANNRTNIRDGQRVGVILKRVIDSFVGMFAGLNTTALRGAGRNFTARVLADLPSPMDMAQTFLAVENYIRSIGSLMPLFLQRAQRLQQDQATNIALGRVAGRILGRTIANFQQAVGGLRQNNLRGTMGEWRRSVVDTLPTPEQFEQNFNAIIIRIEQLAQKLPDMLRRLQDKIVGMRSQLRDGDRLGVLFRDVTERIMSVFNQLRTSRMRGLGSDFRASVVSSLPDAAVIQNTFDWVMYRITTYAAIMPQMRARMQAVVGQLRTQLDQGQMLGEQLQEVMGILRGVFASLNLRQMAGITNGLNASVVAALKDPREIEATFDYLLNWVRGMAAVIGQGGPLDRAVREMRDTLSAGLRAQGERLASALQNIMNDVASIFRRLSLANLTGAFRGFSLEMVESLPEPGYVASVFRLLKEKVVGLVREAIPQIRAANQDLEAQIGDLMRDGQTLSTQFQEIIRAITRIFSNISVSSLVSAVTTFLEGVKTLNEVSVDQMKTAFTQLTTWLRQVMSNNGPLPELHNFVTRDMNGVNFEVYVGESQRVKEAIKSVAKVFQNMDISTAIENWNTLKDAVRNAPPDEAEMQRIVAQIRTFVMNSSRVMGPGAPLGGGGRPGSGMGGDAGGGRPGGGGGGGPTESETAEAIRALREGGRPGSFYVHDIHVEGVLMEIGAMLQGFFTAFSDNIMSQYMAEVGMDPEVTMAPERKPADAANDVKSVPPDQLKQVETMLGQRLAEAAPPASESAMTAALGAVAQNTADTAARLQTACTILGGILSLLGSGGGGSSGGVNLSSLFGGTPPETSRPRFDWSDYKDQFNQTGRRQQVRTSR